ncbi:MAG: 2-C-methyl-D-erythritol 2,4-cyclodiphosphate synthase, partial [Firmicutes bacterium]|nr:2-C-methyl-D-erythritol 2,4-cyclodiphosphate synthase [Bacillota bacterium]
RYVLVHDGARPFVSPEVISRVLEGVKKTGACVPVVPPADTVRDDEHTLDRSGLHLVQTPQGFRTDILAMAYEDAKGSRFEGTDDASYVEQLGVTVSMVEGDPANRKMTTKEDMPMQVRAGTGFDVHRFGEAAEDSVITIGGVKIPYERPLLAHSDGDVLTHAIMDAVLGACGLGDIGEAFPDTDPAYEGADSVGLLKTCGEMIREKGYVVSNIDATIIGQEPKFMPYKRDMERILAEALGLPADRINIKATTTEKLGFTGRKEGLAAEAVCLVKGV